MSRTASPPAARRVAIVTPKNDVFVVLLAIAAGALLIGCVLLGLEMYRYHGKVTPDTKAAQANPLPAVSLAAAAHFAGHERSDSIAAL